MIACRYVISGRVQGVGFRWFVMREAGRLELEGYVQNLPDGTVEVLVRGPEQALSELERLLRRGPPGARVEYVEKSDVPHDMSLPKSFGIND